MLIADWWHRDAECCLWTLRQFGRGAVNPASPDLAAARLTAQQLGITPSATNRRQAIDGQVFSDIISRGISLQVDYEALDHAFTSITAFRTSHTRDGLDTDSSPRDVFNINFADFGQRQLSQELRVTSPAGGQFDYIGGVFYFRSQVESASSQRFLSRNPATGAVAQVLNLTVTNKAQTTSYAAFGEIGWRPIEELRLFAGARVLNEEVDATKLRQLFNTNTVQFTQNSKEDDAFVWRLGAQYELTDDVMIYATVTRGFKGGGLDANIGRPELAEVDPERPMSYELGLRSQFLDRSVTPNLTGFFAEVDDYQVSASVPGQPGVFLIDNAAQLESRGIEAELVWRPLDELTILANGAYVDAEFSEFPNGQCFPGQTAAQGCVGGVQNLSGRRVPRAPEFTGTVALQYYGELPWARLNGFVNLSANYRGDTIISFPTIPGQEQEAFTLVNGSRGFEQPGDGYRVSLFFKNLFEEEFVAATFGTPVDPAPGNVSQFPVFESERIVGLTLELRL